MISIRSSLLASALFVAACSSSAPPAQTAQVPAAPAPQIVYVQAPANEPQRAQRSDEVADGTHLTEFQMKRLIGHYSTYDGKSGFTLDRSVDPPRAKLDGDGTIETLDKRGSVTGMHELVSGDKKVWLRISEEGDVVLFQGPKQHEGVEVVRDADAKQLK